MSVDLTNDVTKGAKVLGARWTLQIIYFLQEPLHFRELQELVGGVNPTTLSQRLRFLEKKGLITRTPIASFPRRVDYHLTAMGRDLLPMLNMMGQWSQKWL